MKHVVLLLTLICGGIVWGQREMGQMAGQEMEDNRPVDAKRLFVLGRDAWAEVELDYLGYTRSGMSEEEAERSLRQGCLHLEAATKLDPGEVIYWQDLGTLYMSDAINDPGRAREALGASNQLDPTKLEFIREYVRYRYEHLNDRETREYYLQNEGIVRAYPALQSETLCQLGILALERGAMGEALQYFEQSFSQSFYNPEPLARILAMPMPEQPEGVSDEDYEALQVRAERTYRYYQVIQWRIRLHNNPFDLASCLRLIEALDQHRYHDLTRLFYEHAFRLLDLGLGGENAPALRQELLVNEAMSMTLAEQYREALEATEKVLGEEPGNLICLSLEAWALRQIGMDADAKAALRKARASARRITADFEGARQESLLQRAWFFSFVDPDAEPALAYGKAAYERDPNNAEAAGLYAYGLYLNDQKAQAQNVLDGYEKVRDAVAALTQALLHKEQEMTGRAGEVLEGIEGMIPPVAQKVIEELRKELDSGEEGPAEQDNLRMALTTNFTNRELEIVTEPGAYLQVGLRLESDIVSYGEPIVGQITISNLTDKLSGTQLILGSEGILDPHVLIFAEAKPTVSSSLERRGGGEEPLDAERTYLLSHRYVMDRQMLSPGRSFTQEEALNIRMVREMLENRPQQNWRVRYQLIVDPVRTGGGGYASRIAAWQPPVVTLVRKAFVPTTERMAYHFRQMSEGSAGDMINTMRLFGGLLREDYLNRTGQLTYKPAAVNVNALYSTLVKQLSHENERVRAWAAYELRGLPLSSQEAVLGRLSEALNEQDWFVRYLTVEMLDPLTDLGAYYQWIKAIEAEEILQRQTAFYLGEPWEVIADPIEVPEAEDEGANL